MAPAAPFSTRSGTIASAKQDQVCIPGALLLWHPGIGPWAIIALGHDVTVFPYQSWIVRLGLALIELYPAIRFRAPARSSPPEHLLSLYGN